MAENHKENGECKKSFTKNRVYKSQIIKYILLVKIKELNELEQSLRQKNNNKNCITFVRVVKRKIRKWSNMKVGCKSKKSVCRT